MGLQEATTVIIAAFGGWSDASEATTEALDFLIDAWDAHEAYEVPADDHYDYLLNRPEAIINFDGQREIEWPRTTVYHAHTHPLTGVEVYLVLGDEPNLRWRSFCDQIFAAVPRSATPVLITLGSMAAGLAHSRPFPVYGHTNDTTLQEATGYEASRYEGPTGILGVMQSLAHERGIPSVSLWTAVPEYTQHAPCPKASLALLRNIEDLLDVTFALDELTEDARAWERSVQQLATEDEEIADYVRTLEASQDTVDLPEASGEAIAKEFERYLRRRER
jgi:proteasome assembly chaperone (PAC2) family protein